jgi:hypothetical protein
MSEIEKLISESLDAVARTAIPDERPAPPHAMATLGQIAPDPGRSGQKSALRRRVWAAPLLSAAVVAALAVGLVALGRNDHQAAPNPPAPAASNSALPASGLVTVRVVDADEASYGVGMPIVVSFSRPPTDPAGFERAATVTLNDQPAGGAWYWVKTLAGMQALYRPQAYWPANSYLSVRLDVAGVSAGAGLRFAGNVSATVHIGNRHVSTVSDRTKTMTVTDNGRVIRAMPVSLGAPNSPTARGTKYVTARDASQRLTGPGYDLVVRSVLRLSTGEYVLPAPWATFRTGRIDQSAGGGTDLSEQDGDWFYEFSQVGDVIAYPDAGGPVAATDSSFVGWNVPWTTWQAGGALH